jgi:hypothetical protein
MRYRSSHLVSLTDSCTLRIPAVSEFAWRSVPLEDEPPLDVGLYQYD